MTESGPLPHGLNFSDNGNGTAAITGTPSAGSGGIYPITVTAANTSGPTSQAFTLQVNEAPVITSPAQATAVIGAVFSFHITATGFPSPKVTASGALPKGLTFNSSTATLSGTPRPGTSGNYPITVTAKNATGAVAQNLILTVSPATAAGHATRAREVR